MSSPFESFPKRLDEYRALGAALDLLSKTDRKILSISAVEAFIRPALKLGLFEIALCKYRKAPRAMLIYAYLTQEKLSEFKASKAPILHLSEWNEGDNFCLMDVICPFGDTRAFLKFAYSQMIRRPNPIFYKSRTSNVIKLIATENHGLMAGYTIPSSYDHR